MQFAENLHLNAFQWEPTTGHHAMLSNVKLACTSIIAEEEADLLLSIGQCYIQWWQSLVWYLCVGSTSTTMPCKPLKFRNAFVCQWCSKICACSPIPMNHQVFWVRFWPLNLESNYPWLASQQWHYFYLTDNMRGLESESKPVAEDKFHGNIVQQLKKDNEKYIYSILATENRK